MKKKHKGKLLAENNAILIFFFSIRFALSFFLSLWIDFFSVSSFLDVLKALKNIYVDFIVQCVWLFEHVKLFSYYVKTQLVLKHMDFMDTWIPLKN